MLGIWVPSAGAPVPVTSALGRSVAKVGLFPASANPLAVFRSAPATVVHRFRYRPVHDFGLGVRSATLALHLASVAPRGRLRWASPVLPAVASSTFVLLFKWAALAFC